MTSLEGAVVLVTGGNRGLGAAIVEQALKAGAAKVYATARDPKASTDPKIVPLALDVTDPSSVATLAERAPDVTVLVNNAGITNRQNFLDGDPEQIRAEFDTNFFGPLLVTRAIAPVIARNGGGHVLNVASVLSWLAVAGGYSASKAALWSMSNSLRLELLPQDIKVTTLHVAYIDTDMTASIDAPKSAPEEVCPPGGRRHREGPLRGAGGRHHAPGQGSPRRRPECPLPAARGLTAQLP